LQALVERLTPPPAPEGGATTGRTSRRKAGTGGT
jgi:hypothetical protein